MIVSVSGQASAEAHGWLAGCLSTSSKCWDTKVSDGSTWQGGVGGGGGSPFSVILGSLGVPAACNSWLPGGQSNFTDEVWSGEKFLRLYCVQRSRWGLQTSFDIEVCSCCLKMLPGIENLLHLFQGGCQNRRLCAETSRRYLAAVCKIRMTLL